MDDDELDELWHRASIGIRNPYADLIEVMEEPVGGISHGRRRSSSGRWVPLEPADFSNFEETGRPVPATSEGLSMKPLGKTNHGSSYAYQGLGCRCDVCKSWWATYVRERRNRDGVA